MDVAFSVRRFERALVAGGAGFLGSWVVEVLTDLGVFFSAERSTAIVVEGQ